MVQNPRTPPSSPRSPRSAWSAQQRQVPQVTQQRQVPQGGADYLFPRTLSPKRLVLQSSQQTVPPNDYGEDSWAAVEVAQLRSELEEERGVRQKQDERIAKALTRIEGCATDLSKIRKHYEGATKQNEELETALEKRLIERIVETERRLSQGISNAKAEVDLCFKKQSKQMAAELEEVERRMARRAETIASMYAEKVSEKLTRERSEAIALEVVNKSLEQRFLAVEDERTQLLTSKNDINHAVEQMKLGVSQSESAMRGIRQMCGALDSSLKHLWQVVSELQERQCKRNLDDMRGRGPSPTPNERIHGTINAGVVAEDIRANSCDKKRPRDEQLILPPPSPRQQPQGQFQTQMMPLIQPIQALPVMQTLHPAMPGQLQVQRQFAIPQFGARSRSPSPQAARQCLPLEVVTSRSSTPSQKPGDNVKIPPRKEDLRLQSTQGAEDLSTQHTPEFVRMNPYYIHIQSCF
eukprot:gnl/MRDRNA2_/MRDRNA2_58087_c0_seq1.p1 gnl/MRDRNA2_/MRDRNA2_58087_c0~~gnl/MRDRNA2_/MRDRNA2_58087_c0_seq1.p1  ORF type:complete len:466 (-),score=92.57 gnl/MRDRNA2_/MRDRNA2_58087_c0_seq1:51-1448(-)